MERAPSARGPNSIRPWNQPTAWPACERIAGALKQLRLVKDCELRANASETPFNFVLGEFRAEVRSAHGVHCAVHLARSTEMLMVGSERRAEGAAGIPRRWLNPDALKGPIAQYFPISHAIEGDAAGKAEIVDCISLRQRARDAQHDFLSDLLHRGGEIHITLRERGIRIARRSTKEVVKLPRRHGQSGRIVEVALVEPEGAVVLNVDQVVKNQIGVSGLAIGREPHELIFAELTLKPV